MKRILKIIPLLGIAIVCGLLIGFLASVPRKVGISEVQVSKLKIGDEDTLIVDSPEHPPWAQQHITSVEFDYDHKTISIIRYYVILNPLFGNGIYSRWPIVIRNGLLVGNYKLRFWQGDHFETVGEVVVGDKTIDYQPVK